MADYGNELLEYLKNDPFESYEEYADEGLFKFSASEINLNMEMDTADSIGFDESLLLSKNGIKIEGYFRGRKRYPLDRTTVMRLCNSNILLKREIEGGSTSCNANNSDCQWFLPMEILNKVNSIALENGVITPAFSSISGNFGDCIASNDYSIDIHSTSWSDRFVSLGGNSTIGSRGSRYANRAPVGSGGSIASSSALSYSLYQYHSNQTWWFVRISTSNGGINAGFFYNRNENSFALINDISKPIPLRLGIPHISNREGQMNWDAVEPDRGCDFMRKYIMDMVVEYQKSIDPDENIESQSIIFDDDHDNCFIFSVTTRKVSIVLRVFIIKNYSNIRPVKLLFSFDSQPISNIVSDLCFIFNSYFQIKDFNKLVIYPVNTAGTTIDISDYLNFIGKFDQSLEEYNFQDYSLKSKGMSGGNAFGFDDDKFESKLNMAYLNNYKAVLTTEFSILRTRNEPDITDLPDIAINDQIISGNYNFGLVKKIGYELEGRVYALTCIRYLSDMNFTNFFNL